MHSDRKRKWENSSSETVYTYNSWAHMKDRCLNPEAHNFEYYGGRGISICDRWQNDYDAFFNDMGERPEGTTIERVNNDRDYGPENCIWASMSTQNSNRRSARILTYRNVSKAHFEWARLLGVSWENLRNYISRYGAEGAIAKLFSKMEF